MPNTPEQAIAVAASQSAHGPRYGTGECQRRVHEAYGVPTDGTPDAATDWLRSKHKHPVGADLAAFIASVPRGALLAWTGGTHGYGHRAIAAGHGMMWGTDARRAGFFDLVPITQPAKDWGLRLAGWTEDTDGVHVFTPPTHTHPFVRAVMDARPGPDRVAAMRRLAAHGAPGAATQARVWLRAEADKHRTLAKLHKIVSP